jgi:ferredoxin
MRINAGKMRRSKGTARRAPPCIDTNYFEGKITAQRRCPMKASVKTDQCIGCGLCADVCPGVFVLDSETNVAKSIIDRVPAELKEKCREAAKDCPVEAIVVEE